MKKILLVDDEHTTLVATLEILKEKYELIPASSSREALALCENTRPDLILTDFMMIDITGFEMVRILEDYYMDKFPVLFMTADDTEEADGREFFHSEIVDFIKKPFDGNVLLERISDLITLAENRTDDQEEVSTTDKLTGFLFDYGIMQCFPQACKEKSGTLMILDLDSFRLVNSLYGYEKGDELLKKFANLITTYLREDDLFGRVGGDEFTVFTTDIQNEGELADFAKYVNEEIVKESKEILGNEMEIPIGASIGAVFVPKSGTEYEDLERIARNSLELVKKNGKHGYAVRHEVGKIHISDERPEEDMRKLSMILEDRNDSDTALWLNQDDFGSVYRFLSRFLARYKDEAAYGKAYKVLFTIVPNDENMDVERFEEIVRRFGDTAVKQLRRSDLMMQSKNNQFLLLLPVLDDKYVNVVIQRIKLRFFRSGLMNEVSLLHTAEIADFSAKK